MAISVGQKAVGKGARRGRPFAAGNDPRRNTTTPGSGRPPNEFKAWIRGRFWDHRERLWNRAMKLDRDGIALLSVFKSIGFADQQEWTGPVTVRIEYVNDWRRPHHASSAPSPAAQSRGPSASAAGR